MKDGNSKSVRYASVAELRALLDERAPMARAIAEAVRRGDLEGTTKAQEAMRQKFQE